MDKTVTIILSVDKPCDDMSIQVSAAADAAATMRPEPAFTPSLLMRYTDAELIAHIDRQPDADPWYVRPLSTALIAKEFSSLEKLLNFVQASEAAVQAGVPTPRVHRVIAPLSAVDDDDGGSDDGSRLFCIMDRVLGSTLRDVWPSLGWVKTVRLGYQLRKRVVEPLRAMTSDRAGSLAGGRVTSPYLNDAYGLPDHATPQQVDAFLNFWARFSCGNYEAAKTPEQHAACRPRPVFALAHEPAGQPFVLVHHNLVPRNLMLEPATGTLQVLDWDVAGYYPPRFEYAAMLNLRLPSDWSKCARRRWKLFAWVAAADGRSDSFHHRLLDNIKKKANGYASEVRRFNIRAGGYASAAARMPPGMDA